MNLSYKRGWREEVQELSYGFVFGWLWIFLLLLLRFLKVVCLSSDGGYYYLRVHAMTVIALPFCFRLHKESEGECGAIQNKKYIFVA